MNKDISNIHNLFTNIKINNVLESIIESLFFANIWIYSYTIILNYLNRKFPAHVVNIFLPTAPKSILQPEPFEISLYLILTFFLVLFICFYYLKLKIILKKLFNSSIHNKFVLIKLSILFTLVILFIVRLGEYPMKQTASIFNGTYLLYLTSILLILIIIPMFNYFYIRIKNNFLRFSIFIFIILTIALFTFQPKFPISPDDYSFFFGPIYEVVSGKTIFTDIISLYGFSYILVFAFLVKAGLIQFTSLITYIWYIYIIQYTLCFYLIYKISKSSVFATLGLFSIMSFTYFFAPGYPATAPQFGPIRWLQMVLVILLFYKIKKIDSKLFIFLTSLLSFLIIDVGIAIIFSYLFTLFLFYLKREISFKQIVKSSIYFLISIIGIFLIIDSSHLLFGYKSIDVISLFTKLNQYSRYGLYMLPIPNQTYFWFAMLIYFSSVIYFFKKKSIEFTSQLILLSANISLFASIYFVGRSHKYNLFYISLMALLNLFILLGVLFEKLTVKNIKISILISIFIFLIAVPIFNRQEAFISTINEKFNYLRYSDPFKPIVEDQLYYAFKDEVNLINSLPGKEIVVISYYDTLLLYLTGKHNLLNANPQAIICTKDDLDHSLKEVRKVCPKKMIVDCRIFNKCREDIGKLDPKGTIQFLLFASIEKTCNSRLIPVKCTNKLCVVEEK